MVLVPLHLLYRRRSSLSVSVGQPRLSLWGGTLSRHPAHTEIVGVMYSVVSVYSKGVIYNRQSRAAKFSRLTRDLATLLGSIGVRTTHMGR